MIYLNKGEANKIVLTLTENSLLSSPFYWFVFENEFDTDINPEEIYLADTSLSPSRYNLFTLTEGTDLTLDKGQYVYKVYESNILPSSIDDTTLRVVEEGRMVVGETTVNEEENTTEFNSIYK